MKVLMIHNQYQQLGGEEVTFESERDLLRTNGHDVETIVFDNANIRSTWDKTRLAWTLFYNRQSAARVEAMIDSFRPDIIHVYNLFYLATPAVLTAAARRKVPVVMTIQNYRLICTGGFLMRNAAVCEKCVHATFPLSGVVHKCNQGSTVKSAQVTLVTGVHKVLGTWQRQVARYIAVTDFARTKLLDSSLRLSPEQIVVKPSSIPDKGESAQLDREPVLLYVGRLSAEKGINTLLKAFESLPFQLEIIGDGPMRPDAEAAAAKYSNIKYLGYQKKDFLIARLKQVSAMIVSSVWYECLPSTILEAFSTGTPVVISNIGNLNEIVTDGYNGLFFEPGNANDLGNVIQKLMTDRPGFAHLYTHARKTYEERYAPRINYMNLTRIYQEVIDQNKARGN